MSLLEKRFHGFKTRIKLSCIEIFGTDAEKFLQGQTTNCVKSLLTQQAQYNTLLNRQGRIEFFFVLTKIDHNHFYLWLDSTDIEKCAERLNTYIIADDVELKKTEEKTYGLVAGLEINPKNGSQYLFYGEAAWLIPDNSFEDFKYLPELLEHERLWLYLSRGFYSLNHLEAQLPLLNETIASEIAWNHQKGCFLGQEVVQKIYSRRGAAIYPFILVFPMNHIAIENIKNSELKLNAQHQIKNFEVLVHEQQVNIFTFLPRSFQLDGLDVELQINSEALQARVKKISITQNLVDDIYHLAISLYSKDSKDDEAINLLKKLISLKEKIQPNPEVLAEWYEALGAILGKVNRYEEAIEQMLEVAKILPDEVMPYTNLSLYAMKLGRIEEAEKYKEEATVKSFFKLGKEAKSKKIELDKNFAREKMFKDVLDIDEFDPMALCGLAEIHLLNKEPKLALEKILKLQSVDDNYTQSYILGGLAQELLGQKNEAILLWQKGLKIALTKGELMPAQQIQGHLQKHISK